MAKNTDAYHCYTREKGKKSENNPIYRKNSLKTEFMVSLEDW